MATFDIVNKLDMQALDNAINNATRKISQRYDLKGADIEVELNKKDKTLKVVAPDDMKFKAVQDVINESLISQKLSMKLIDWGQREDASLGAIRVNCKLVEGLDKEVAKEITKKIKDSGLKVKTQIQGEQVRVDGKKIDDLQAVIAMLKGQEFSVPLQFENMKR